MQICPPTLQIQTLTWHYWVILLYTQHFGCGEGSLPHCIHLFKYYSISKNAFLLSCKATSCVCQNIVALNCTLLFIWHKCFSSLSDKSGWRYNNAFCVLLYLTKEDNGDNFRTKKTLKASQSLRNQNNFKIVDTLTSHPHHSSASSKSLLKTKSLSRNLSSKSRRSTKCTEEPFAWYRSIFFVISRAWWDKSVSKRFKGKAVSLSVSPVSHFEGLRLFLFFLLFCWLH